MSRLDSNNQQSGPVADDGSMWIRVPSDAVSVSSSGTPGKLSSHGVHYGTRNDQRWSSQVEIDDLERQNIHRWIAILWRRRYIVLGTTAVLFICALVYLMNAIPIYEATASIMVPNPSNGPAADRLSEEMPVLADLADSTKTRAVDTQVETLRDSRLLHDGALQRLTSAQRAAVNAYAESGSTLDWKFLLKVAQQEKTDIVKISTQSYSASVSTALAQALCDEYLKRSQDNTQSQVRKAADYVGGELQKVRHNVDAAALALETWKQNNNTLDLSVESENKLDTLKDIETDLRQNESDLVANQAKLGQLRNTEAQLPETQVAESDIIVRPVVQDLESQLTKLQLELLNEQQIHTDEHPHVQVLKQQIAKIQRRLQGESHTEVGSRREAVNPVRQQVEQNIADLEAEVRAGQTRANTINSTLQTANASLATLPQKEYQLGKLTADLNVLKDTYQMLNQKYQTLLISEQGELTSAQIVAPPILPTHPISPRKAATIFASLLVGLLLGITLAVLIERIDDRVHSEADATLATHLPVLARIPFIEDTAKQLLISGNSKSSALLESYRMLRTNIGFSALDRPLRSILVTSSQPNEGKSMTSLNLAMVMVMNGKKVVLVDCDLRRPTLHKLLGLPNKVGFTTVVAGLSSLEAALQETSVPNLRVLTSGPLPPNPPELIDSRAGRGVLDDILEISDLLILDSPPALAISDAQTVSGITDATLLVVSANEAGRRQIERTSELLSKSGHVIGIVLNKMQATMDGYYGYLGYYGYKAYGSYYNTEVPEVDINLEHVAALTENRNGVKGNGSGDSP